MTTRHPKPIHPLCLPRQSRQPDPALPADSIHPPAGPTQRQNYTLHMHSGVISFSLYGTINNVE
eukprot:scaffold105477_cov15-Prasinocladus_malaysianus.AAC.1